MAEGEGWQIADGGRKRSGGRERRGKCRGGGNTFQYRQTKVKETRFASADASANDSRRWDLRLIALKQEVADSAFFAQAKEVLASVHSWEEQRRVEEVVCYGIGNFSSSKRAGYQFALLLLLHDWLAIEEPVRLFEPFLTEFEKAALANHGCELISLNEEAKRVVQRRTLFFMPHVDKCLYSNLLWANWGAESLPNIIIFGNSFTHYDERIISRAERRKAPYLFKALEVMEEEPIEVAFGPMPEAFNDQCVIAFRRGGAKLAARASPSDSQAADPTASFWWRCREADLPVLAVGGSDVVPASSTEPVSLQKKDQI